MQLAVEANAAQSLLAVRLEAAVDVVQVDSGDDGRRPVEDSREDTARPRIVTPRLPPRHEIEALVELGEQLADLCGIVLEIGVDRHHDLALGLEKPSLQSGGLAEVPAQVDGDDVRGLALKPAEDLEAAIGGAVVHEDHLVRLPFELERRDDLAVERL